MYCRHCGATVSEDAIYCSKCGGTLKNVSSRPATEYDDSRKDWLACLLLCLLFGHFGAHRFYVGKYGTAVLQILTLGGLGIWMLIDLLIILIGKFKDKEGKVITPVPRVRGDL